jgi:hypothetical protein
LNDELYSEPAWQRAARELKNAMSLIQLAMVRTFGHDALLGPDEPPIAIQRGRKATRCGGESWREIGENARYGFSRSRTTANGSFAGPVTMISDTSDH